MMPCRTFEGTDPSVCCRDVNKRSSTVGYGCGQRPPRKVLGPFNLEMRGKTGNPRQGVSGWMSCSEGGCATKTGLTQWSPKQALSKALHPRSGQSEVSSARNP